MLEEETEIWKTAHTILIPTQMMGKTKTRTTHVEDAAEQEGTREIIPPTTETGVER